MKSQKGVTLISLIIYLIVMTIVVTMITIISGNLYNSTSSTLEEIDGVSEFVKFNTFFTREINENGIEIVKCETFDGKYASPPEDGMFSNGDSYIVFKNGDQTIQYTYKKKNKSIYRNQIKICSNVDECKFIAEKGDKSVNVIWPTNYKYSFNENESENSESNRVNNLEQSITYKLSNW